MCDTIAGAGYGMSNHGTVIMAYSGPTEWAVLPEGRKACRYEGGSVHIEEHHERFASGQMSDPLPAVRFAEHHRSGDGFRYDAPQHG
jgi:hypothetical protein